MSGITHSAWSIAVRVAAITAACYLLPAPAARANPPAGNLRQRGAFTCDLVVDAQQGSFDSLAAILERDRMLMSGSQAARGMRHKVVPATFPPAWDPGFPHTLVLHVGGRYLFDTRQQAATYESFVRSYALGGELFLARPMMLATDCHSWDVVAASEFVASVAHRSLRTERWSVGHDPQASVRAARAWDAIQREAVARGHAAVWLLYNREEGLLSLVVFDEGPDLLIDAWRPSLGAHLEPHGWPKTMDRAHWVVTTWLPFAPGDRGAPSVWPNYPLIPALPECGDGVCEPSRDEDGASCHEDCTGACGDAVCNVEEDEFRCPGDCQLY